MTFRFDAKADSRYDTSVPPEPPKKALCAFFLYRLDVYDFIKQ